MPDYVQPNSKQKPPFNAGAIANLLAIPRLDVENILKRYHKKNGRTGGEAAVMRVLVTGGGGFLGRAIVQRLLARGERVRSFARGAYPDLRALGVDVYQGDLTDAATVTDAVRGCDLVFHVAARPGVWGRYRDFYRPNVLGTRNVLDACLALGVRRLVYTSSPSVVFDGRDMEGVDERVPYPDHYEAHYPKTKAIAERLVLAANGPGLATVALRPHLIWGPGDNHLVPRILERGRSGTLRRFRGPAKLVDSVYIDNAADAHLQAADRLTLGSAIGGRAYFISNGEPWPLWELVDRILQAGGSCCAPAPQHFAPTGLRAGLVDRTGGHRPAPASGAAHDPVRGARVGDGALV